MADDDASMDVSTAPDKDFVHINEEAVLSGYLYKKTRDGRWQRRWFETNGVYLTYYKSRKMEKLLAALSLPQVGDIRHIPASEDPEHKVGLFAIELNTRVYTLRAKSEDEAILWVKTLSHLREQGLQNLRAADKDAAKREAMSVDADRSTWVKNQRWPVWCCCKNV